MSPASARRWLVTLLLFLSGLLAAVYFLVRHETRLAYRVGETAREDIATPVALVVFDPDKTRLLRAQEKQHVPPVFQFRPEAADAVLANFRFSFAQTQKNFLDAVEAAFNSRKLSALLAGWPRFGRFHQAFQATNELFPVTLALAEVWAQGQSDEAIREEIAAKLRAAMSGYICADEVAPDVFGDSQLVRILRGDDQASAPAESSKRLRAYHNRNTLATLAQARVELQKRFARDEREVAAFCAGLLKPNCLYDETATEQFRAKGTEAIWTADRYAPGQVLVREGEPISEKSKRALEQLAMHVAAEQWLWRMSTAALSFLALWALWRFISLPRLRRPVLLAAPAPALTMAAAPQPPPPLPAPPTVASLPPAPSLPAPTITVIAGPSAAGIATTSSDSAVSVSPPSADAHYWQERAREAEHHAAKAKAVVREGLLPHVARWMKDRLVRSLFSQRKQLLETQQATASEVAELEKRLAGVAPQIEKQLGQYEKRIAELQRELLAKEGRRRRQSGKESPAQAASDQPGRPPS